MDEVTFIKLTGSTLGDVTITSKIIKQGKNTLTVILLLQILMKTD